MRRLISFVARHKVLFGALMFAALLSSCASTGTIDPSATPDTINIPIPGHIFGVGLVGILSALFALEQFLASSPSIKANSTFQLIGNAIKAILDANKVAPPPRPQTGGPTKMPIAGSVTS